MSATDGWQFEIEVHPPDWRFPAGKSWLAGWIWSPQQRPVSDLRFWIDGQPYLALHGLTHPGMEQRLLQRPGPPFLGFALLVEPPGAARELRLEVRDHAGHWEQVFRTPITAAAGAPPPPPRPALVDLFAGQLASLLRLSTRQPGVPFSRLADETIAGALAVPLDSLPNPPFFGALEEPRADGWVRFGRMSITGWLGHRTAKIRRLTAMVDPLQEEVLLHGLRRPDLADNFPDLPDRERAGFVGHADLPANAGVPVLLKIFAELENGEKSLVFARRFTPRIILGAEAALPPLSRRTFFRALWALHGAARRHGLNRGPLGRLYAAGRSAWQAYAAEAPARIGPIKAARVDGDQPAADPHKDGRPLRILVVTHNLNFEGAPWFIFELARFLAAQPGVTVRVVSPHEGPMRRAFAEAGLPVEVLDLSAVFQAAAVPEFHAALRSATAGLPWGEIDLVIANTMVSFWAVHAARHAGKPALLYVHESSPVRRFFAPLVAPALCALVEEAFRTATHVVFTADASRAVFAYLGERGHFALLPSWVDVARIDAFAAAHDRAALRRKHGLDPAATLVVNIGSVCERKGQHVFIRAIRLLQPELSALHPGRQIQFVMVGARSGPYLQTLQEEITRLGLDATTLVPETGEIFDYYRLADLFVCTSFEESFPRVLLESAAFQLPIVTTNVNGIPEMLAPDEAWLVPPGDRYTLAAALKLALAAVFAGDRRRPDKARAAVLRKYHEARALPQHAALARRAAGR
jgi:glycosyltransferase involved in cell wall biosynthesis